MKDIKFRVWHVKENKMYFRGYQKWLHVLLCDDDRGSSGGKGLPAKRAGYADCEFLECTGCVDKKRREIYEGDILRVRFGDEVFQEVVGPVPDTFGSKAEHPLHGILKKHGVKEDPAYLDIEVIGNKFENPDILP